MRVITPTDDYTLSTKVNLDALRAGKHISIFLAGTIDNGDSENWQAKLISRLCDTCLDYGRDTIIYNPRRDNWDPEAGYHEIQKQIAWEQEYLEKADLIVMNLLPDSKSPISLMELGQYATSGKLIVFCPNNFYRYDNVKFMCEKYYIPLIDHRNIDESDIFNELANILDNK